MFADQGVRFVGDIAPKVRPTGSGYGLFRNLVLALVYLALVPVVAAAGISLGAQYFPGPTRALLGPALESLVVTQEIDGAAKAEEALAKVTVAEDRLAKIEQDVLALIGKSSETPVTPEQPGGQAAPSQGEEETVDYEGLLAPVRTEAATRDRTLAALTAMTLARAEFLAGNRAVALRELTLAQQCLAAEAGSAAPVTPEIRKALTDALDALQRNSSTAGDYLSLAWHMLADALLSTQ